jgi:hypothetical protein
MFYFTTNQLGFEPEFLGRVKLVSSVASLAGIALYNFKLKDVPLKKMVRPPAPLVDRPTLMQTRGVRESSTSCTSNARLSRASRLTRGRERSSRGCP